LVRYFSANGGDTCPAQSFRNARRILSLSDKPNKLFIILTDGGWSTSNYELEADPSGRSGGYGGVPGMKAVPEDLPALIKSIPGTTVFVGLGYGGQRNGNAVNFDISKGISNATELAPFVKSVISHMLRKK
jgi:hypothetical protein